MNTLQNSTVRFLKFVIELENLIIHSGQVPLLHNTVLIFAMKEREWWPVSGSH